jgi:hypothetical protein
VLLLAAGEVGGHVLGAVGDLKIVEQFAGAFERGARNSRLNHTDTFILMTAGMEIRTD